MIIHAQEYITRMDFKYCSQCKQKLPISKFHKDSKTKDGLHGLCKQCRANYFKRNYVSRSKGVDKAEHMKKCRAKYITPYSKDELLSRPIEHMLEVFSNKQLAKIWGVCENEASTIRSNPWYYREDWKHDPCAGEPMLNWLKRKQLMEFIELNIN